MSKLAIVLCAVLFASAANAAVSWSESMKAVQESVQKVINTAVSKVEGEFVDTQLKTLKIASELSDETTKFGEKIWEKISAVTQNVTEEVGDLTEKAVGVNIDECIKLSENLSDIAKVAITTTSTCINGKLKTGYSYIDNTNKASNDVLDEVTAFRETAQHCGDNIDGAKAASAAIFCAKAAANNATWIAIKAAPKLTAGVTKLQFMLVTLQRTLANCESNPKLVAFNQDAATVVKRTDKCIKQKVKEAHSALPLFYTRDIFNIGQI